MDLNEGCLWLVSGPRGCGKSLFCNSITTRAREVGWTVSGIISHSVIKDGVKIAINAEDLKSGEIRLLASLSRGSEFNYLLGKWYMNRMTIEWGNRVLEASLPSDLFIIDELGPLELVREEGWTSGIKELNKRKYRIALLVIRPELLELARERLPARRTITLVPGFDIQAEASRWWKEATGVADE